ncbi:MAG: hypothetical protein GY818_05090 [Planctomycetaceae bacterium]|nr:hypothetical protein [Planctomycetaceae bacterium]
MHSLKNTVVAVGLLALAFMFYQSSSPQPQGDSGEQQASLELANEPLPEPSAPLEIEPEPLPSLDISPSKRLPKQITPVEPAPTPIPTTPPLKPNPIKPSPPQLPKPKSPSFGSTGPLNENLKQKNLANAIRNQASLGGPLRSPNPPNGSLALPPDNSFNAKAGVNLPRKLSSKEIADLWMQVALDVEQNNFKSALKALSNYHASNDLNGPQYQKTMAWLNQLASKLIWSQEAHLEKTDPTTTEIPLAKLAQEWRVSVPVIQKINGLPASKTSAIPSTLKVIKGPFDLKVARDDDKMTLYLGELFGCQFDYAGVNLLPGEYHVQTNNGNILLKTTGGRELVIRGKRTTSSVAPQAGIISLTDAELKEVCELLTLDSTVTIR